MSPSVVWKLVRKLPEISQPIYGHAEFPAKAMRACHERLVPLGGIYRALEGHLKRPLRVLELGSAQGFFCFSLAQMGAIIHGIDYLNLNIAVCDALGAEHPAFKCMFERGDPADAINLLQKDKYDFVIGFGLLDHLLASRGLEFALHGLSVMAEAAMAALLEMPSRDQLAELGYGDLSDAGQLCEAFSFANEMGSIPVLKTDLRSAGAVPQTIHRPIYAPSNYFRFSVRRTGAVEVRS